MNLNKELYNQIPNKVVYTYKKGEDTIINTINNNKTILTILAINELTNPTRNMCRCTITLLLDVVDVEPNKRNVKQMKELLQELQNNKYIESNVEDFLKVKQNDSIKIIPKFFNIDNEGSKTEYFQLFDEDVKKIMEQDCDVRKKYGLLELYCFYCATVPNYPANLLLDMRPPLVSYHTYESIHKNLGLHDKTICEYIKILEDIDLIVVASAGQFYKMENMHKVIKTSPNFVTLARKGNICEQELKFGIKAYRHIMKEEGWKSLSDEKKEHGDEKKKLKNKITRLANIELKTPEKFTEHNKNELNNAREEYEKLINKVNTNIDIEDVEQVSIDEDQEETDVKPIENNTYDTKDKLPDFIIKNSDGFYEVVSDYGNFNLNKGVILDKNYFEEHFPYGAVCDEDGDRYWTETVEQKITYFEALVLKLNRVATFENNKKIRFVNGVQVKML